MIKCECGCGTLLEEKDKYGRKRRFVSGHNNRKYSDPTQYKREWNHRNRDKRRAYKKLYHRKRKVDLIDYKRSKCFDCGVEYNGKNASIFHFHHLRDKKFAIGNRVTAKAWQVILEEADKCVMLCANCHEMRHSGEF